MKDEASILPNNVTVKDAAEIIGVSVQMARYYCSENILDAEESMPESGKWRIGTSQLMHYPGWEDYMDKRVRIQHQSVHIANFTNQHMDDL